MFIQDLDRTQTVFLMAFVLNQHTPEREFRGSGLILFWLVWACLPFRLWSQEGQPATEPVLWSNQYMDTMPVLVYTPGQAIQSSEAYALFFRDSSLRMGLQEGMRAFSEGAFSPWAQFGETPNLKRGKYGHWAVFRVTNPGPETAKVFVRSTGLKKLWVFSKGQLLIADSLAYMESRRDPWKMLPRPPAHLIYLELPPKDTFTIWSMSYYQAQSAHFAVEIGPPKDAFIAHTHRYAFENMTYPLLIGGLMAVFLFAIARFVQRKETMYLWYAGYAFSVMFISWRNLEGFNPYFVSTLPYLPWASTKVFHSAVLAVTYGLFVKEFMGLKYEENPALYSLYLFYFGVCGVASAAEAVLLLMNKPYESWLLYYFFRWFMAVFALLGIVPLWFTSRALGRFIVAGSLCLIFAEVLSNFVPNHVESGVSLLGVTAELIFFSLGLSYRSKLQLLEHQQLQELHNEEVLENQRLHYEKRMQAYQLRNRIAQDLHDELGAGLTRLAMEAEYAVRVGGMATEDYKGRLRGLATDTQELITTLREVVFAIDPEYDRFSEMQAYFQAMGQRFLGKLEIRVDFDLPAHPSDPSVAPDVKRHVLLIFNECLQNIAKHARATEVRISFRLKDESTYFFEICDNGQGADLSGGPAGRYSHGLPGIKQRAAKMGAVLTLESAPGAGFCLRLTGPVHSYANHNGRSQPQS